MGWTNIKWDDALRECAVRGLVKMGIIIAGQAIRLSPVGQYPKGSGRVGGRLKGSITYATRMMRSNASGVAGREDSVSTPADDYTLHVGTNVEYAPYVEYGTRFNPTGSPFLRVALDITRKSCAALYGQEISKELKSRAK